MFLNVFLQFLLGWDVWDRVKCLGYSEASSWEYFMPQLIGKDGLFQDPYDKNNDTTFKYSKYLTWYSAKLDWLLFHNFNLDKKHIKKKIGGNTEGNKYSSSDHNWLCVNFK